MSELLSLKEASEWASKYLGKKVTTSNISYLIQYGRIKKIGTDGFTKISKDELIKYYKSYNGQRETSWKDQLGEDLNWALSFDQYKEDETTKHVHRLHPYKGKFIPQLVEYFIDNHIDNFKKQTFFLKGDIILDPFSGSGTTLVQANELGIHSIGIDISRFNCMITDTKLLDYDQDTLETEIDNFKIVISNFEAEGKIDEFEKELYFELAKFNNNNFPSPEFKRKVFKHEINEFKYAAAKEKKFLRIYNKLVTKYKIALKQEADKSFLDKWYIKNIRKEIDFAFEQIK